MTPTHVAPINLLLATLPARSRQAFLSGCDRVELSTAQVVLRSGEQIRHVYFPLDCYMFLVAGADNGQRLEVGMVGDEGMLGVSVMLGVAVAPHAVVVQGAGAALRMGTLVFQRQCGRNSALSRGLKRYAYVLMDQLAHAVFCTHYHVVEARLARWLLMTRDRAHANQFRLTHETLSVLLGARRAGVTRAASSLRRRKLIRYSRGNITIVDERGLEAAACSCYAKDRNIYAKVLS
ncbi:MAG: Crp/Fnr family transcriptional regulator [Steroidobacteraceae bacterium]|jgi:CRP-like cAMP-binding protein